MRTVPDSGRVAMRERVRYGKDWYMRDMPRLRKLLALAVTLTAMAVPASASALKVGIGGISATQFTDPRFLALGIHEARVGVAWNVAISHNAAAIANIKEWLAEAAAAHVTPMVSFSGINAQLPQP